MILVSFVLGDFIPCSDETTIETPLDKYEHIVFAPSLAAFSIMDFFFYRISSIFSTFNYGHPVVFLDFVIYDTLVLL